MKTYVEKSCLYAYKINNNALTTNIITSKYVLYIGREVWMFGVLYID
jgi:hypothetical protein